MADATHEAAAAGHDHAHPPHVQHHFDSSAQQFDASKFGMWLFLVTEVLFFSGLFCAYAIYRRTHPQIFEVGQYFLDVKWGAINTVVLITSSFTMALGVWCAQRSYRKGLIWCLVLTLIGAFAFMGIKAIEYSDKIMNGKVWGAGFNPVYHHDGDEGHGDAGGHAAVAGPAAPDATSHAEPASSDVHADEPHVADAARATATDRPGAATDEPASAAEGAAPAANGANADGTGPKIEHTTIAPPGASPAGIVLDVLELDDQAEQSYEAKKKAAYAESRRMKDAGIFINIYFCLTGLHGIHVLGGIVVISWLLVGALKGRYHSDYYTPVDLVGLYWHVVDLIWIFLFPLLYLIK